MAFRNSLSRSLLTTARSLLSPPSPTPSAPRLPRRRFSSGPSSSRNVGALVGSQSLLLPLNSVTNAGPLTSYLSVGARAFCELSQGH